MTLKLCYILIAIFCFIVVELIKRLVPDFYKKIKSFVPVGVSVLSIILVLVLSLIFKTEFETASIADLFLKCFQYGIIIAGSEVLSYEAIFKHIINFFIKLKSGKDMTTAATETVEELEKDLTDKQKKVEEKSDKKTN